MRLNIVTGRRYLWGFVEEGVAEERWLAEKVQGWAESLRILVGVSHKEPQSAYAELQKLLQQEWAFVPRFIPGIGDAFVQVEEALRETFLLAPF